MWLAVRCHSFYCRRSAKKLRCCRIAFLANILTRVFWCCSLFVGLRFFVAEIRWKKNTCRFFRSNLESNLRWFWVMALARWVAWSLDISTSRHHLQSFRCFSFLRVGLCLSLLVSHQLKMSKCNAQIQIDIRVILVYMASPPPRGSSARDFTVFFSLFIHFRFQ